MQPQIHTPDDYWTIARRVLVTRKELRQMTLEMERDLDRIKALRQSRTLAPSNPATEERLPFTELTKTIAAEIRKVIEITPPSNDKS